MTMENRFQPRQIDCPLLQKSFNSRQILQAAQFERSRNDMFSPQYPGNDRPFSRLKFHLCGLGQSLLIERRRYRQKLHRPSLYPDPDVAPLSVPQPCKRRFDGPQQYQARCSFLQIFNGNQNIQILRQCGLDVVQGRDSTGNGVLPDRTFSSEFGDDLDRFPQGHVGVPPYSGTVALIPSIARRRSHWLGR